MPEAAGAGAGANGPQGPLDTDAPAKRPLVVGPFVAGRSDGLDCFHECRLLRMALPGAAGSAIEPPASTKRLAQRARALSTWRR